MYQEQQNAKRIARWPQSKSDNHTALFEEICILSNLINSWNEFSKTFLVSCCIFLLTVEEKFLYRTVLFSDFKLCGYHT